MKYCKTCILPDTRPNILFGSNGSCCSRTTESKNLIDWAERESKFCELVSRVKEVKAPYDCIIPVSGGKDSTWQVLKILSYGLNPLTFTYKPILRNKIGQSNLDNLKKLGVHHIDFTINENA